VTLVRSQAAADRLVELQGERAHLDAENRRVTLQTGPARFLAMTLGIADPEAGRRPWLQVRAAGEERRVRGNA